MTTTSAYLEPRSGSAAEPAALTLQSRKLWLGLVLALAVVLAIRNRFVQDDGFISFRYAHNLVYHHSLTWNEGDLAKLEGYTNFLWTLLIAAFIELGVDPVLASMLLGIAAGVGTLCVVYRTALLLTKDFRYALLTVLLLGTNFSFSSYMTGGLETQLQTLLLSLVAFGSIRLMQEQQASELGFCAVGLCAGLAIMTRLDSPLVIGVFGSAALWTRYRTHGDKRRLLSNAALLLGPILLIVVPWLAWKHWYYGDILPNSFYLKGTVFNLDVLVSGFAFLYSFFGSYHLIVPCFLFVLLRAQIAKNPVVLTLLLVCVAWSAYIMKVGGDFMEYRFMVPILPYIFLALVWAIQQQSRVLQWAAVLLVIEGTISHQVLYKNFHRIESIHGLNEFVYGEEANWKGIGVRLKALLTDPANPVVIATTAAGAVPYYSELKTVDMLGVNDKWIARHGEVAEHFRPGHSKRGTLQYYLDSGVHLLLGHPQLREHGWSDQRSRLNLKDFGDFEIARLNRASLPEQARIVEIPIDQRYSLFALYLKPSPAVASLINEGQVTSFGIE